MMSALKSPVINDIATKGGYNLLFPLIPQIGPVPECEWLDSEQVDSSCFSHSSLRSNQCLNVSGLASSKLTRLVPKQLLHSHMAV